MIQKRWLTVLLGIMSGFILLQPSSPVFGYKVERKYYEKKGQVIWDIPTPKKEVAITFDDGPNPKYTPKILDVLKKYDAKATFLSGGI